MAPGRWKGIAALLVCAHCSLGVVAAVGAVALGGASVPVLVGVRLDYVALPLGLVALFAGWLWWGWRASARAACDVPQAR